MTSSRLMPLLLPGAVSVNARSAGGLTAYTIVAGELPVVTYLASNGVASPDFSFWVNWSMVALLPSTACATFFTSLTTPQPVSAEPVSKRATAATPAAATLAAL